MQARFITLGVVAALALTSTALQAQANTCPPGTDIVIAPGITRPDQQKASQDACQIAVDVFQLMAPQLGTSLAGGNATLGQGGTLGGFPHFAVGLRGNVIAGDVPDFASGFSPSTSGRQQRELASKKQVIGLPVADLAIGVFKGFPIPPFTNVGGVDLLVSAAYVPKIGTDTDDFQLTPDDPLKLGFGVRVGLLQESILVPGVSVSYIRRDLPTTDIAVRTSSFDARITDVTVKTAAWRVVASKSLLIFGLAAGVGQDTYDMGAQVQATTQTAFGPQQSGVIVFDQDLTRTNFFLDASMNLPFIKIVGEIGQVSGGTVNTYNTFSGGRADKSRVYGSVGVRIGL